MIEKGEGFGYIAHCPAIPGCHSQGDTIEEAIENIKDAFVGTNAVVHPNVKIGEGAVIGSNSLVLTNIEPWSINVGSPCKKVGERQRVMVEDVLKI